MKILITQLGCIGDMILITPMFRALAEHFPSVEIDVLAGRHNFLIIKDNPRIENIFVYEKTPARLFKLFKQFKRTEYDVYIDPKDHYSTESRFFAGLVDVKMKIGFNMRGKNVFNKSIPPNSENEQLHFIERVYSALMPLGIPKPESVPRPELFLNSEATAHVDKFISGLSGKPLLIINLSAGEPDRIWNKNNWRALLNKVDYSLYDVVLIFTKKEIQMAKELRENFNMLRLFPSRSILDVIALIAHSKLVISTDTSIVHIASAFNIPLIGIYKKNERIFNKFRPLSDVQSVIFPGKESDGINNIAPEIVINEMKKLSNKILK